MKKETYLLVGALLSPLFNTPRTRVLQGQSILAESTWMCLQLKLHLDTFTQSYLPATEQLYWGSCGLNALLKGNSVLLFRFPHPD